VSDCFQKLGDLEATAEEAPGLAAAVSAWLVAEDTVSGELTDCVLAGRGRRPGLRHGNALENPGDAGGAWTTLWTSGLEIEVARQVYYGGGGGVSDAACPNCGNIKRIRDFSKALDHLRDMIEVLTSMCARLCGRRGARNRAMRAVTATKRQPGAGILPLFTLIAFPGSTWALPIMRAHANVNVDLRSSPGRRAISLHQVMPSASDVLGPNTFGLCRGGFVAHSDDVLHTRPTSRTVPERRDRPSPFGVR
jgi:hypothetical protein